MGSARGNLLGADAADHLQDHGCDEHEADAGEDAISRLDPAGGSIENGG